jgi:hypothetical protein
MSNFSVIYFIQIEIIANRRWFPQMVPRFGSKGGQRMTIGDIIGLDVLPDDQTQTRSGLHT